MFLANCSDSRSLTTRSRAFFCNSTRGSIVTLSAFRTKCTWAPNMTNVCVLRRLPLHNGFLHKSWQILFRNKKKEKKKCPLPAVGTIKPVITFSHTGRGTTMKRLHAFSASLCHYVCTPACQGFLTSKQADPWLDVGEIYRPIHDTNSSLVRTRKQALEKWGAGLRHQWGAFLQADTFNTRRSKRAPAGVNSDCWGYARSLAHQPPIRGLLQQLQHLSSAILLSPTRQQKISSLLFTLFVHGHSQIPDLQPKLHRAAWAKHTLVSCS